MTALLPERCAENSVGCLYLLPLRSHSAEVALVQRSVEASLQRSVDVGQSHQVLGFLEIQTNTGSKLSFQKAFYSSKLCL